MKGKLKTIAFLQVLILLCSIIAPTINVFASTSKTIKITSTGITSCNVTIAVGMTPTAKQNNSKIIKINNVNENFFYLQGGVDYTKLKGIKKFMLKMVAESVIKEKKPEDKELIDIFLNGGNCVKEENSSEIVEYLKM